MKKKAQRIADLPGLGLKSEATLQQAGIDSLQQLQEVGAVMAFYRLKQHALATNTAKPSLNFLYALVGGLSNRSWLEVAQTEKSQLLNELDNLERLESMFDS